MKKIFAIVVFLALAVIFTPWLHPATAEQVDVYEDNHLVKSVVFKIGVPVYVVNGQTPGVKMDVSPFIQDDRTFVPVRFLGNALGVSDENINWNGEVRRVFVAGPNNTSLVMTLGVKEIVVDGQARAIDVAPVLTSDRTFLPARYVAEGLGYEVAWDETTQTVVCWPAGQPKPDVSAAVEYLSQVQEQPQANQYIPAGWEQVSYSGVSAYIPPGAENRYKGVYFMEKGIMVQFDDADALTISYPCKQYSDEKTDQVAKDLLLANIGGPDLVQQIWEYGAQKTTRGYLLPFKLFPGTEKFKEIQVGNDDGCIAVTGIY
ncbi:hypothetical protein Psch_03470 [Pelotomaculum schinkii]|uniref:Copper amine oxidase-like N-terminal domain-containing protein n=1 Tax=Pelotomaculum schinkii TaxID=78350 RepID=A0A4Y7R6Y3_9FIRM|nr:copper amine oxidase N-terminal domain-containing protein [Pelotomaculum schinkii]TEB04708.1 hypothetical protein Psch_03470 [Pelotomaculum schinkii]